MAEQPIKHGQQHGPLSPDPIRYASYHYIVRGPTQGVIVKVPAAVFTVTRFMHVFRLMDVEAGLVEVGSADVEIMVRNDTQGVDMLSTELIVPSGDLFTDLTAASPVKVDDDALVEHGDRLFLNVVGTGVGAKGLEIILVFI